jgi:hypothetical protein
MKTATVSYVTQKYIMIYLILIIQAPKPGRRVTVSYGVSQNYFTVTEFFKVSDRNYWFVDLYCVK